MRGPHPIIENFILVFGNKKRVPFAFGLGGWLVDPTLPILTRYSLFFFLLPFLPPPVTGGIVYSLSE